MVTSSSARRTSSVSARARSTVSATAGSRSPAVGVSSTTASSRIGLSRSTMRTGPAHGAGNAAAGGQFRHRLTRALGRVRVLLDQPIGVVGVDSPHHPREVLPGQWVMQLGPPGCRGCGWPCRRGFHIFASRRVVRAVPHDGDGERLRPRVGRSRSGRPGVGPGRWRRPPPRCAPVRVGSVMEDPPHEPSAGGASGPEAIPRTAWEAVIRAARTARARIRTPRRLGSVRATALRRPGLRRIVPRMVCPSGA